MDWGIALGIFGAIGVDAIPATLGVAFAIADRPSAKDFRFVRGCFYVTAVLLAVTVLGTFWFYQEGTTTMRIVIAAFCGAIIFGGLVATLDWTRGREIAATDRILPEGVGGKGGDAKVGGNGIAIGGRGGKAGKYGRGGDGGGGEVAGDGIVVGGEGGSAGDDGVWRPPARSGYELYMESIGQTPDPFLKQYGRGGAEAGYEPKLQVVEQLRASYFIARSVAPASILENIHAVPLDYLNEKLREMGEPWRARIVQGQYEFFLP